MWIYLKLFLTAIFWGGTFAAGRIVAQHIGPYSASFLRFFTASLCLLGMIYWREGKLPRLTRQQIIPAALLGMTGVFSYNVLFFIAMKTVDAGRASLITATNPVFISLLSALFFRERLNTLKILGAFLSLAGAAVVISRGNLFSIFTGGVGWGEICVLGSVASWVAYSLIGKALMKDLTPLTAVTYSCLIGAVALLFPAYLEGVTGLMGGFYLKDWLGIAYLGFFGTVLGFFWYYEGISAIGASRASVFINFVPVSGIFFGWWIFDETINFSLLAGASLVIAGVYLTNRPR